MNLYNCHFYEEQRHLSRESAEEIIPIIMDLFRPKSVVDVGCGIGTWLSVFATHGITEYLGIDGDYVDRGMLRIPEEKFLGHDLKVRLNLKKIYDLAISLEVAEHIEERYTENYIQSLTSLSNTIVFSAAVPGQGGVGHINEQWPDYWIRLFEKRGYEVYDIIRPQIWNFIDSAFWYNQNILVFINKQFYAEQGIVIQTSGDFKGYSIIHPESYLRKCIEVRSIHMNYLKIMYEQKLFSLITQINNISSSVLDYYKGRAYKELKCYERSTFYLQKYLESGETEYKLSALYHLGEVFYYLNNTRRAEETFQACMKETRNQHLGAKQYLEKMGYRHE